MGQLILLSKHYSAFNREAGLRYFLVGPGEIFTWATILLTIRAIFNLDVIYGVYFLTWVLHKISSSKSSDISLPMAIWQQWTMQGHFILQLSRFQQLAFSSRSIIHGQRK